MFFSCIPWYCFSSFFLTILFDVKTRLGNPEVRKVVDQSIHDYLTEYLELHPDVLDSILSKSLNAFKVIIYFLSLQLYFKSIAPDWRLGLTKCFIL